MTVTKVTQKLSITFGLYICLCASVTAQEYPTRPIQIVSAVPIGSATDILARHVSEKLRAQLGGAVIVINKPGAGGTIAAEFVAKSPPDGYTLLFGNSALTFYSFLHRKLSFDVVADLAGIGLVAQSPFVVVVNNDLGAKSMQDLLALAKAKPKGINFASAGFGSATHMACELLAGRAGVELTHVPYANTMSIASDLQSNTVQMMCSPLSSILPMLAGGRLSIVGVSADTAMSEPIEVPSVKQSTGIDFVVNQWFGLLAPRGTPAPILNKLADAVKEIVDDPDFRRRLKDQALEVRPLYLNGFDDFIVKEQKLWGPVVEAAGVKMNQ